jgi:hypothetical protein
MSSKPDDEKFAKWRKWLLRIETEVGNLVINKHIFWKFQNIIRCNPRIQDHYVFTYLCAYNYERAITMGIRRQVEGIKRQKDGKYELRKDRTISFSKFLLDIFLSPDVLSRQRYCSLYGKKGNPRFHEIMQRSANSTFDYVAGKGNDYFDKNVAFQDLKRLLGLSQKIRIYADKIVAHHDKSVLKSLPKHRDINKCVNFLEKLFLKYNLLLNAVDQDALVPANLKGWDDIFRFPWIQRRGMKHGT